MLRTSLVVMCLVVGSAGCQTTSGDLKKSAGESVALPQCQKQPFQNCFVVRGNAPSPERVAEIHPGEISRDEVRKLLGRPSTVGNYNKKETWFYFSERVKWSKTIKHDVWIPKLEVIKREVVVVQFDTKGVVSKIRASEFGNTAEINQHKKPNRELTVIDQILRNFEK